MARAKCPDPARCTAGARGPCRKCHPGVLEALHGKMLDYWSSLTHRAIASAKLKAQHRTAEFVAAVLPARRSNVARINARRKP